MILKIYFLLQNLFVLFIIYVFCEFFGVVCYRFKLTRFKIIGLLNINKLPKISDFVL